MEPDDLQTFIDDVGRVVASTDGEHEITQRVAKRLSDLLASGYRLPVELTRPSPERHVTYPLYIAPDNSWSMASVVWDVGQQTPVHSHETWGVVGIYAGIEHEVRYLKPVAPTVCSALTPAGEELFGPGQVNICCTTDDDVHAVAAVGNEPPSESTSRAATSARSGGGRTTPPPAKPAGSCPAGTAPREAPLNCAATRSQHGPKVANHAIRAVRTQVGDDPSAATNLRSLAPPPRPDYRLGRSTSHVTRPRPQRRHLTRRLRHR
jgi:3-mercaptopropionate dioxygenase